MTRRMPDTNPEYSTGLRVRSIDDFLAQQAQQDVLRFITCGSVDDGKSTLIGRLLWDAQQLFDDQLAALVADSKKHGTQGDALDYALLVDGLAAEREQGITIDVAYRFFSTARRKFIVADTPGHEQYTRNMVTGASTASLAVLLVDARKGLLTQTKRHAYLCSLMRVRHVVLAVNKMDLVGYCEAVFGNIRQAFETFALDLGFESITSIPLSALQGDNIVQFSAHMPWYNGPTLMGYLESLVVNEPMSNVPVFSVQWVNRPDADFRGFSGTVLQGTWCVGDRVRVTQSGQVACIQEMANLGEVRQQAYAGDATTLVLDRALDISRGDVLSKADQPLESSDQFEAHLMWFDEQAGLVGRSYEIKLLHQWAKATLTRLKHRVNVNTLAVEPANSLAMNEVARCQFALDRSLVMAPYSTMPGLGSFILVDRFSHETVAAGMITHSLRRASNVHRHPTRVSTRQREALAGQTGKVIWLTGLSGSGKSTLANALEVVLHESGVRSFILDGDNLRHGLNKDLGFTDADRVENIRRVAEVAKLMADAGLVVVTALISPYRRDREMARELIGAARFWEVFVDTPLKVCEQRDVKGLYAKARRGEIPNFTGVGSTYEPPEAAEVVVDLSTLSEADAVALLLNAVGI